MTKFNHQLPIMLCVKCSKKISLSDTAINIIQRQLKEMQDRMEYKIKRMELNVDEERIKLQKLEALLNSNKDYQDNMIIKYENYDICPHCLVYIGGSVFVSNYRDFPT